MKFRLSVALILSTFLLSCNDNNQSNTDQNATPTFQNKGHELVYNMVQKVGNYTSLWNKKDVVYTYTYETPDGKADVSTEKYLFDGELSYGAYNKHERTFPELEGQIEQGYDGSEFWLRHDGQILNDSTRMKRVAFNRPTNFYWFAMLPKLTDPGLNYEHLGEQIINDNTYDVVKVTFDSNEEKTTDIYQLYINKNTSIVDQFLFTVADFGVIETPYLMKLEYEEVDGMMIPTTRIYKKSNWEAEETDEPWIKVTWSNIKFNNGLTLDDFKK
ncbi:hypothetical protein SAMN06298216_0217 [Spirosomataceae bacterium TFI 002]|nr:hypothetical protein SAMN06298216_0217 [Spirosomataceae bacterium TFI 002]